MITLTVPWRGWKLCPCTLSRHVVEWRDSSTHSCLQHEMGQVVSFIVPPAVLAGRKFEVPINQDSLCTSELVWTLRRREESLAHGGNEATVPWIVQSVSQLLYQLNHPRLKGELL